MDHNAQFATRAAACERLYQSQPRTRRALMLASQFWLNGQLSGDKTYTHKAYHIAATTLAQNAADVRLHLLCVFLCIELNEAGVAAAYLTALKPYRAAWKDKEPLLHGAHLYVSARLECLHQKPKAARKHLRALAQYSEAHPSHTLTAWLGELYLHNDLDAAQPAQGYALLQQSFVMGNTSPFLFLAAARYYHEADTAPPRDSLFPAFLRWALAQGFDLSILLTRWTEPLAALVEADPSLRLGKALYAAYAPDWALGCLCRRMIADKDTSAEAFAYYKAAAARQIFPPRLDEFLILSAYKNGEESLLPYALTRFLQSGDPDAALKPFLYHLLLTREEYAPLAAEAQNDMLAFGCHCLEHKLAGREYFSLYCFILQQAEAGIFTDAALIQTAEALLQPVLFAYDLTVEDTAAKHIWVFEKEKTQSRTYDIHNSAVRLSAASPHFEAHCFGEAMHTLLPAPIRRQRLVANADVRLYLRFFRAGFASAELLIALASHCMTPDLNADTLPEAFFPALEQAIAHPDISQPFRMRAAATLGNAHAANGDFTRAAALYQDLDENALEDKDIERMLLVFLDTQNLAKAALLIVKKASCISDRTLFTALKQLAATGLYDEPIAQAAYALILKSWHDKALLSIVLAHYKGSQAEWQALSAALAAMSVSDQRLDEMILQNAIFTHTPDTGAQRVFTRGCDAGGGDAVSAFAQYLAYEIIVNGFTPAYETIDCMEALFLRTGDHFTAYALAHVYLAQSTQTVRSADVLQQAVLLAEEDGFIFPIFKQLKDKTIITPYIEKNRPFIYKAPPDRRVLLVYRTSDNGAVTELPMRYIRFGLHMAHITHFFDETITYQFCEQMLTGSVLTKEDSVTNSRLPLLEDMDDAFYAINSALIHERMFKYEQVEAIIAEHLQPLPRIKGKMI